MAEFALGVLSSVAATAITVSTGWIVSRRSRQWAIDLLARLTGTGIHRVYHRQKEAEDDLARDLARARWIDVLAGRGNELTRDVFAPLRTEPSGALESARILLPDPESGPQSWLSRREADIERIDPGFRSGLLADQIRTNSDYLSELSRKTGRLALRYYDMPNMHRLVITDRAAYVTFYDDSAHGRNSSCIYARNPGIVYSFASQIFATTWKNSRPVQ